MDRNLSQINTEVYEKCGLVISDFQIEAESKEYDACRFELNGQMIISRNSKITPKKAGQFVTFWQRNENGIIEPLKESERIDYYIVNVRTKDRFGQFVFPKSILISKGIISTSTKEGKRGFRVYPKWDTPKSKQAEKTQKWQLDYFYVINKSIDRKKTLKLYESR